jgi:hypothetical protein
LASPNKRSSGGHRRSGGLEINRRIHFCVCVCVCVLCSPFRFRFCGGCPSQRSLAALLFVCREVAAKRWKWSRRAGGWMKSRSFHPLPPLCRLGVPVDSLAPHRNAEHDAHCSVIDAPLRHRLIIVPKDNSGILLHYFARLNLTPKKLAICICDQVPPGGLLHNFLLCRRNIYIYSFHKVLVT